MMGQRLLETNSPLLHFLYLAPPFYYWAGRVCSLRKVRPRIRTQFPFLCFMFFVLFSVAVAGVVFFLKGTGPASLNCAVFPLHSFSCPGLLLLGVDRLPSLRAMRQNFFDLATL